MAPPKGGPADISAEMCAGSLMSGCSFDVMCFSIHALITTEEPGYRIEEMLPSLVAPLRGAGGLITENVMRESDSAIDQPESIINIQKYHY